MTKKPKGRYQKICGKLLKIENYGAGVRWCCPVCDYNPHGTPGSFRPSYSMTHSPIPQPPICKRPVNE